MIARSICALGSICRSRSITSQALFGFYQSRTLFATQTLRDAPITDEKNLWIEDNLLLDVKEAQNETLVEAIPRETGREGKVIPNSTDHSKACPLCRLNIRNLEYTDVMILSQFIKKNGSLVTYHESKLCSMQYLKVKSLIKKAQRCNLIRRPADYLVPGPWHNFNTYIEPDRRRDQPIKISHWSFIGAGDDFEPHLVRIERRLTELSQCPNLLPYRNHYPILTLSKITNLLDLHPFFKTLVKVNRNEYEPSEPNQVAQQHEHERQEHASAASLSGSPVSSAANYHDPIKFIDATLESDFLVQ